LKAISSSSEVFLSGRTVDTTAAQPAEIAAHALSQQSTLVTNNTREFARVPGLALENWVQDA
jgi:hypothetical protein